MAPLDAVVILGALVGALSGVVPGLHPNLVAAVAVTAVPVAPAAAVPPLLAALGAHSVTSFLPSLWGAPDEGQAGAQLPAHRLVRAGLGREAVQASLAGSLGGLAAGVGLAVALGAVLDANSYAALGPAVPWLVAAAWLLVVASEPAWPRRARALGVGLVAGALGVAALGLAPRSPVGLPASSLTPLLSGLFAVPVLLRLRPVEASPDGPPRGVRVGTAPVVGALAALPASILPGFTSGPATAAALSLRRGRATPTAAIATASAVNTAVAVVATAVLHAAGRARSGVHVAAAATGRFPTPGAFPQPELLADVATVCTGALVGAVVLALAARALAATPRWAVPAASAASLGAIVGVSWATGGGLGLALLAASSVVGELPERLGVRRSQLMACLMLPVAWRAVG